jgi:hypothetical protein
MYSFQWKAPLLRWRLKDPKLTPMKTNISMKMLILGLVLSSASAQAYSVATHKDITVASVIQYNRCIQLLQNSSTPVADPLDIEYLVDSNLKQDRRILSKATNWHFYNPYKRDLGSATLGLGRASFEKRFKMIEKTRPEERLGRAGALSHYIQDVTNPAHIVPAYHFRVDGYDQYEFKKAWPQNLSLAECQAAFQYDYQGAFNLVTVMSLDTLNTTAGPVVISRDNQSMITSWSAAFWSAAFTRDSKQAGFGSYGFLGNSFGVEKVAMQNHLYQIEPSVYENFARQQIQKAIKGTVILFVNELKP